MKLRQTSPNDMVPALEVKELKRFFRSPDRRHGPIRAVDGVSLALHLGEITGLLGESGCGKSTLGEVMVGLQWPTAGEVRSHGMPVSQKMSRSRWREFRRQVQIMFQNPFESVNPRFKIIDIVGEPLEVYGVAASERREQILSALESVGLSPPAEFLDRYPHELSGGQLQRACIARALMLGPSVLIADEPVSMLDLSVRAGILTLLERLKYAHNMAVLLISHDISTLVVVSDKLAVMYLGKIVEAGATEEVIASPSHPYLQVLLNSVPTVHKSLFAQDKSGLALKGDIPDASNIPSGCRLWPRCPLAEERCKVEVPTLRLLKGAEPHVVACHLLDEQTKPDPDSKWT